MNMLKLAEEDGWAARARAGPVRHEMRGAGEYKEFLSKGARRTRTSLPSLFDESMRKEWGGLLWPVGGWGRNGPF